MHSTEIWVALAIISLAMQVIQSGTAFACVGVGCLAGLVSTWCGAGPENQFGFGLVGTLAAILYLRPRLLEIQFLREVAADTSSLIGKTGVVSEAIDPAAGTGHVLVNQQDWKAKALYEGVFAAGEEVEVISVEGVKLLVRPLSR